jgi:hypothetical protein
MSRFQGNRIVSRHIMRLVAKPDAVFPLLCPKRELEWIDGWNYEMIYSTSGIAELGCMFKTNLPPEGEAYWIMTKHIPPSEAEYVRFVTGLAMVRLNIKLSEIESGSEVVWELTYTGITDQGNEFIAEHAEDQSKRSALRLERSLNHFFQTGEKLQNPI